MKAKLLPELSWSKWYKGEIGDAKFSYLYHWNGLTHLQYHDVSIARYYNPSVSAINYEVMVNAGVWGEMRYLFVDGIPTAKEARRLAEEAAQSALHRGDLQI